ncbi:hypothetical protein V8F20_010925 [Naviculisporaceae sp. PSN 640]
MVVDGEGFETRVGYEVARLGWYGWTPTGLKPDVGYTLFVKDDVSFAGSPVFFVTEPEVVSTVPFVCGFVVNVYVSSSTKLVTSTTTSSSTTTSRATTPSSTTSTHPSTNSLSHSPTESPQTPSINTPPVLDKKTVIGIGVGVPIASLAVAALGTYLFCRYYRRKILGSHTEQHEDNYGPDSGDTRQIGDRSFRRHDSEAAAELAAIPELGGVETDRGRNGSNAPVPEKELPRSAQMPLPTYTELDTNTSYQQAQMSNLESGGLHQVSAGVHSSGVGNPALFTHPVPVVD